MKTSFLTLAFLFIAVPAFAAGVKCPATMEVDGASHPLANASLFDGPPEEMADLKPDYIGRTRSMWKLSALSDNRDYYLVCHYEGAESTEVYQLARTLKRCTLNRSKKPSASCR